MIQPPPNFKKLEAKTESSLTKKDEIIAVLEEENQSLKDKIAEGKFAKWFLLTILLDALCFQHIDNGHAVWALLLLELIGLMIAAKHYRLEFATQIISVVLSFVMKNKNNSTDK